MAEDKQPMWPSTQAYDFGQGERSVSERPAVYTAPEEESTGVEDVRYDVVTNQGAPDNPGNTREVVERGVVNVANPPALTDTKHKTPALSSEEQQRVDATAGIDRKIAAYRAYIDSLPELETPEKRAKREKLEKSKRIIGAVSDGLRAMSNLWFTSQYAPNMYNHEKDSQLNETNRWIDKAKAEREKLREEHLRYAIGLGDAENERAKTLLELEEQQERQKLAREKAQREAEQHGWLALLQPDKQREQAGKANRAEQEAITAKAVADYAPEMQRKKGTVEDAKAASYRASAGASSASAEASRARAGYYRNGGSAGAKKHHFRGKEYVSEKDYTKDVTEAARQYNERHKNDEGFVPIVIEREERTGTSKRTVPRKPEEFAGEVERRLQLEEEDNRPPSRRNNDNRPPSRQ